MMLQAEARTTAAVTNECIANVVACQIAVGGKDFSDRRRDFERYL